jgi:hypothetical protein
VVETNVTQMRNSDAQDTWHDTVRYEAAIYKVKFYETPDVESSGKQNGTRVSTASMECLLHTCGFSLVLLQYLRTNQSLTGSVSKR